MRTETETLTVVLAAGAVCRPVLVWRGTRTRLEDRLVGGFDAFPRRQHFLDATRTWWQSEHDLPIGAIVTTARGGSPYDGTIHLVTEAGLEPLSYDAAWDRLDPAGAANRAAQRALDARADAAGLPRELTRFVGSHGLQNGVHPLGNSHYFAERCTARQAYWRRATLAEARAWEEGRT